MTEITNRAALTLLEDIEARRLANEELAAKAADTLSRAIYANREEVWRTALRIVAAALPRIIAETEDAALDSGLGRDESVAERPSWQVGERITRRAARRMPIRESPGADQHRGIAAPQAPQPGDSRLPDPPWTEAELRLAYGDR